MNPLIPQPDTAGADAAKPVLAVTLGDPAGTGPELITKAFAQPDVLAGSRLRANGSVVAPDSFVTHRPRFPPSDSCRRARSRRPF